MRCIVTAGPTFEPLDQVRRLTNFSTGKLGTELARFLTSAGHEILLLRGEASTFTEMVPGAQIEQFNTTADLASKMEKQTSREIQAIFHAAAVSDFRFGRVVKRMGEGRMEEAIAGKLQTHEETSSMLNSGGSNIYYAELIPTPKIIPRLRSGFPNALIVGWKYEVDGTKTGAIRKARAQIAACQTDACVVNGPAYGAGFALLTAEPEFVEVPSRLELFAHFRTMLQSKEEGS